MQVSLSEYLKTHYRPDCEYIDGQLVERNVGMFDQSWMMGQAIFHFEQYRESLGLLSLPSLRVQVSSTRFRVPDVTVVRGDPHEQILTHPPFLLIEILSPEDSMISMLEKIDDYLAFGAENIWIIDPSRRKAFWADANGIHAAADGVLVVPPVEMNLATMWPKTC